MIEVTTGTLEEQIIKFLQKTYPVTVKDIKNKLNISEKVILRTLKKLQLKDIVQLDILPDKIYVRLLRSDFSFIGRKQQKKFIKHKTGKKRQQSSDYNGYMFQ
ncbi:MAG: HTH domain-containing protein [Thermoplasmatota archaeon]|jgi:predicted ArsR family transcriptional regulator